MEGTAREHVPNEIWVMIFECLQFRFYSFPRQQGDVLSLAQVALVNRHFNAVATRLLYHTLPINSNLSSRYKLASTLIQRPEMAKLVHGAEIIARNVRQHDMLRALHTSLETCSTHSTHLAPFFEFLRDRCLRMWSSPAEHTVFFLYMLPNLRMADLDVDISSEPILEILKAWPNSMLSRVEHLRLRNSADVKPPARRSSIDYLIQIPRIRTFHGAGIKWEDYQGPALGLQHLVLNGLIRTHGFYNILSHCPKLETLKIETWWPFAVQVDFSVVGNILRSFGLNLVRLALFPFRCSTGTIGPLGTLNRLKELTIPWNTAARKSGYGTSNGSARGHTRPRDIPKLTDLLPSSLEYLGLHLDCVYLQNWQLLDLVQSERFSRLQTIRLTRDGEPVYKYGERQAAFRRDLSKLGWDLRQSMKNRLYYPVEWVALLEKGSTQTLEIPGVFEAAETADSFDIYGLRALFELL